MQIWLVILYNYEWMNYISIKYSTMSGLIYGHCPFYPHLTVSDL